MIVVFTSTFQLMGDSTVAVVGWYGEYLFDLIFDLLISLGGIFVVVIPRIMRQAQYFETPGETMVTLVIND